MFLLEWLRDFLSLDPEAWTASLYVVYIVLTALLLVFVCKKTKAGVLALFFVTTLFMVSTFSFFGKPVTQRMNLIDFEGEVVAHYFDKRNEAFYLLLLTSETGVPIYVEFPWGGKYMRAFMKALKQNRDLHEGRATIIMKRRRGNFLDFKDSYSLIEPTEYPRKEQ